MSEETVVIDGNQEPTRYRDIPGYPGYRVGSDGTVWSCRIKGRTGKLSSRWKRLQPYPVRGGYLLVRLYSQEGQRKEFLVHTLVLTAFVGPCPVDSECCHQDGDPGNNRLENLRWDTHSANCLDKRRQGRPNGGRPFVPGYDPRRRPDRSPRH